uniref:B12-binding domain-containing protein n=1 Tax=Desulfosporosinus sp. TaxID=157907 RepID=UPI00260E7A8F
MFDFTGLSNAVIEGDNDQVLAKVKEAISANVDPLAIINQGLIGGMNVVGQRFKVNDMFVPEVLMSARSMNAGIELVKPLLAG